MTNRLVPFLAFVLFLSFVASVSARLFRAKPPPPGPTRTTLAAASEMPGVSKTPAGDGPVLRVALLLAARCGDVTAIADVRDVSVVPDVTVTVPLTLKRPLLPEFDGANFSGVAEVRVTPAKNGLSILRLNAASLLLGGAHAPAYRERWVVRVGEPLVRQGYVFTGALAVVLLPAEEARASDGGTLSWWKDLFRRTGRRPFLDGDEVAAAAGEHRPEGIVRPWAAASSAPLNATLGLWMLGDLEGLADLRSHVSADPGFLDRAFASMRRDRVDEEWVRTDSLFALQILELLPFDDHQVQPTVSKYLAQGVNYTSGQWRLRSSPPVRTFRFLDDPAADDMALGVLKNLPRGPARVGSRIVDYEYDLFTDIGRYALEHDPPADRAAVVEAWEGLREEYLSGVSWTAGLLHRRPGFVILVLVLIALVSIGIALIPRGPKPKLRIKNLPILGAYAATVLIVNTIGLGPFIAPVFLVLGILWLRSDVSHPWWERAALGIAAYSAMIHLAFRGEAEIIHPVMITIGDAWYGFAWLVLGRVVLSMPENRDSMPFRAFLTLHVFTVVQGTAAILSGQTDRAGPAVLTMIGVAAAALLWFSLEEPVRRLGTRFRRN